MQTKASGMVLVKKRIWAIVFACAVVVCAFPACSAAAERPITRINEGRAMARFAQADVRKPPAARSAQVESDRGLAATGPETSSGPTQMRLTDVNGTLLSDDFYFYRDLLSDEQAAAYDAIVTALTEQRLTVSISRPIAAYQAYDVVAAVFMDHPELYWVDPEYKYYYDEDDVVVSIRFQSRISLAELDEAWEKLERETAWVLRYASRLSSDAQKVKAVHDYICHVTNYVGTAHDQSVYGALVDKEAVCAGYARAFQYLLMRLRIPTTILTGYARTESHMWNLLLLDGEYYLCDVTWDDPPDNPADEYHYDYFNVTDSEMSKDHTRDGLCKRLPYANGTRYAYSYFGGAYGTDFSAYDRGSSSSFVPPGRPTPVPTEAPTAGPQPILPPQPIASPTDGPVDVPAPLPTPVPEPQDGLVWGSFTYDAHADGTATIQGATAGGDIVIPVRIQGRTVTSIAEGAFKDRSDIRSVHLPTSLEEIGKEAFARSGITDVFVPASVTTVEEGAFESCGALQTAQFAAETSLPRLAPRTFANCTALQTVEVPASASTIGEDAFRGCTQLRQLTLHSTLKNVRQGAFSGCASLAEILYFGTPEEYATIDLDTESGEKNVLVDAKIRWIYGLDGTVSHSTQVASGIWILSDSGMRAEELNGRNVLVTNSGGAFGERSVAAMRLQDVYASFRMAQGIEHVMRGVDGEEMAPEDTVGTGSVIRFMDGEEVLWEADVVVPGDVTGSGHIGMSQIVRAVHALSGKEPLTGVYLRAADADNNGMFSLADVLLLAHATFD